MSASGAPRGRAGTGRGVWMPVRCRADRDSAPSTRGERKSAPADGNVIRHMSTMSSPDSLASLRERHAEILRCASEHGARNVRVFGSAARGEAQQDSDIDLLVEMEPGRSLLDLVGLWQDLEDMLGSHVDVLSERSVSPHLRDRIYSDAIAL